jgi:hypothetical protein
MNESSASKEELTWRRRFASRANNRALTYFSSNTSELWEIGFSHAVLANAAHCAGDSTLHELNYRAAAAVIANLPNGEDKTILETTMNAVPKPG